MNYPLISEYIEAIKSAKENFEELSYLRPVMGDDGLPVMTSGNFAVVFKMKGERDGKLYAVKCFTKEQEGRAEAYRQITEELKDLSSPYLTSVRYLDKELFVDTDQTNETEFPVLLMDWVEGKTLDNYLRENLDDRYALEMLAYRFSKLAQWLIPQPFAHGDLKPDNILVREDGTLVLVDYDGMYVPAMKGQKARELGSPDFRHPLRTEDDFDEHIDNFPLISILLSLKAISNDSHLLEQYGATDRLLFTRNDYCDIINCSLLVKLYPNSSNDLNRIIGLFSIMQDNWHLNYFSLPLIDINVSFDNSIVKSIPELKLGNDRQCGVEYSEDGKTLIRVQLDSIESFIVKDGTEFIDNYAFRYGSLINRVILPPTIKTIGYHAFSSLHFLKEVVLPNSITKIRSGAFSGCSLIASISIPNAISSIEEETFYNCVNLQNVTIPSSVVSIGDRAFCGCVDLQEVTLPPYVAYIGRAAFANCTSLKRILIPSSVSFIGDNAFAGCNCDIICNSPYYRSTGKNLFSADMRKIIHFSSDIKELIIPDTVIDFNEFKFSSCPELKRVVFPCRLKKIDFSFDWCDSLQEVILPHNVNSIPDGAFYCSSLEYIEIPDTVNYIGVGAFQHSALRKITLPKSIKCIEASTFGMSCIEEIVIPSSVKIICGFAFDGCCELRRIVFLSYVEIIEPHAFDGCELLKEVVVPQGLKKNFQHLLPSLKDYVIEEVE